MKTFRLKRLTLLIYAAYCVTAALNCNKISQGEQRRKFEFLYRMSNYAALANEYSVSLIYFKDIHVFKERMNKMKSDIEITATVKSWSKSESLKQKFIVIIGKSITSAEAVESINHKPDDRIDNEYEVILIKERIQDFSEELYGIISEVGKE